MLEVKSTTPSRARTAQFRALRWLGGVAIWLVQVLGCVAYGTGNEAPPNSLDAGDEALPGAPDATPDSTPDSGDAQSVTPCPDPYFSSVVLLMHFDGANGSPSFPDVKQHPIAVHGGIALTATSRFGDASANFDNPTAGSYLTSPTSIDWDLTAGDSTVEMWIQPTTTGSNLYFLSQSPTSGDGQWSIGDGLGGGHNLTVQRNGGGANLATSVSLGQNAWQHIAVVRSAGKTLLFVDGVMRASGQQNFYTTTSSPLLIGAGNTANGTDALWRGYLDELRITKGVARYTTDFSPPTAAFPDCP
jgi:hypothetical protein